MLKDKSQLTRLLSDVKENKVESLEILHYHFKDFIKKYSKKYSVDLETLEAEFDFVLLNIINNDITDPKSILKYINTCFKNFKNFNVDKVFSENDDLKAIELSQFSDIIPSLNSVENEVMLEKFPQLSKCISCEMIEILEESFIDNLSYKTIGKLNNLSKQRISQKIIAVKNILEKEIN